MFIISPKIKFKVFYIYFTLENTKRIKGNNIEFVKINE